MGLYDLMVEAAKKKGVRLSLFQIPREVMEQNATTRGDVRFFELAYLDAEIKRPKKLTAEDAAACSRRPLWPFGLMTGMTHRGRTAAQPGCN
jgi:hypothetical protein